jgi:hypothetical protein
VSASEIHLETSKVNIVTKEQFTVTLVIYTDETTNAVEGELSFPQDSLDVKNISDGNTPINFWIEKPHLNDKNLIKFSGITPGGFTGVNLRIFSIVFEAKKIGIVPIVIDNIRLLKNDGLGSDIPYTVINLTTNIKEGDSSERKEIQIDKVLPEEFIPIISKNPNIFNDKWFASFVTQDKNSGISYYEAKEYRFNYLSNLFFWEKINSPYLIKDQDLKSYIFIRAVDNVGNIRTVKINPTYPLIWYEYIPIWTIIVLILLLVFYLIIRKCQKKI